MNPEHISFRPMAPTDADAILDIINYYITTSTSYFSETLLERSSISNILDEKNTLPRYVAIDGAKIIGFGYAYQFRPESTFSQTVKLTYWLKEDYTRKRIGSKLYNMLESDLTTLKVSSILVNISSENTASLNFHKALGYKECGSFEKVGYKNGRCFDLVWLQKFLH